MGPVMRALRSPVMRILRDPRNIGSPVIGILWALLWEYCEPCCGNIVMGILL